MSEKYSECPSTVSRRRRQVIRPTIIGSISDKGLKPKKDLKRSATQVLHSENLQSIKTTQLKVTKKSNYGHKTTRWEDFDNLATDTTNDNVASPTPSLSTASNYKLTKPKMMPNAGNLKRSRSKTTRSSPTKAKLFNYKPVEYVDKTDGIPTTIIYEELNSKQSVSDVVGHQVPSKGEICISPPPKNIEAGSRPSNEKLKFHKIAAPISDNDFLIKMDTSLNQDFQKATAQKARSTQPMNYIEIPGNEDDTLDLSPIHKSENSFSRASIKGNGARLSYTDNNHVYQEEDGVLVSPILNPSQPKKKRKRKYYNTELSEAGLYTERTTSRISTRPLAKYEVREKVAKVPQSNEGFKDLVQYANFQNDPEPVRETVDTKTMRHSTYQGLHVTKSYSTPYDRRSFFIPEDSEEVPFEEQPSETPLSKASLNSKAKSTTSISTYGKTKVRRYGKNKHLRDQEYR